MKIGGKIWSKTIPECLWLAASELAVWILYLWQEKGGGRVRGGEREREG